MQEKICRHPEDANDYWRERVRTWPKFDANGESFWILTLAEKRHFSDCFEIVSCVSRSPVLFADEITKAKCLNGVKEFIIVHHRPGIEPDASDLDKQRAREIMLAIRPKDCSLLDYIICDSNREENTRTYFPLGSLRSFHRDDPFPPKKPRISSK